MSLVVFVAFVFVVVFVLIIFYVLGTYNSFVKQKNRVSQAKGSIDIYLKQRFDLIPNLVECVKGYMKYEQDMLNKITEMRTEYMKTKSLKQGGELNDEYNKIIAISENYPDLKANEQFLNLQRNLSKMESQLQASRRIYNAEVNIYNSKVEMFPSNILASIFGFVKEDFFQVKADEKTNINIDL